MDNIIKTIDNDMTPRFGHTLTLVCKEKGKEKAVLFGGVTGTKTWTKLNRN